MATEQLEWWYWLITYPLFELAGTSISLGTLLKFILLVAGVLLLEQLFRRWVLLRVLGRTRLDAGLRFAVARFTGYVIITIGFYVALKLVGIDLTSLAVLAGAVGIGIGFGLQNIVSNFISGLIILAERPIEVGHRVEVNGVEGQITQIKMRSTVVVTNNNISVIVPNSNFISEPVVNWSYGDPKVRIILKVGIAYGSDIEKFRQLMLDVAVAHPKVLASPPPQVFFIGFGDSALDFEVGVWTAEMSRQPKKFRSELFFAIEKALRENSIEIPFPQRDLHVRSGQLPIVPLSPPPEPS